MVLITSDSLKTLKKGQMVRYTSGVGDKRIVAIVTVDLVLSRHLRLRIKSLEEQDPASRYEVDQTFITALGKHETLELLTVRRPRVSGRKPEERVQKIKTRGLSERQRSLVRRVLGKDNNASWEVSKRNVGYLVKRISHLVNGSTDIITETNFDTLMKRVKRMIELRKTFESDAREYILRAQIRSGTL